MWTERDQIQAYQFLRRRLVSALVTADPNHPTSPHRRLTTGVALGGVATMLTAAGFGIAGMIQPAPPPDWQHTGLVIEQNGGGRFVMDNSGVLYPVTNLASARLLANGTKTVTVAAALLRSAPRGALMGIPNAPDSLPDLGSLVTDPNPVGCSRATSDLPGATGPVAALLLAHTGDDTATMAAMTPVLDGHGLMVQPPKGDRYLIASGMKYKIADDAVINALGYQGDQVLPVAASWLTTLPSGRDLNLTTVPDVGAQGPVVGNAKRKVGEVLYIDNSDPSKKFYDVVRADGLELVPPTEANLMVWNGANASAYTDGAQQPRPITPFDVNKAHAVPPGDDAKGYPAGMPILVATSGGSTVVCATGDGKTPSRVALGTALPLPPGARVVPTGLSQDGAADEVYLAPGTAVLATVHTDPGAQAAPEYLITDTGTKYQLGDGRARSALGYGNAPVATLPPTTLALLPTGPTLDEADAQKPVKVNK